MTETITDKHLAYIERFLAGERPAPYGWRKHVSGGNISDVPHDQISAIIGRLRQSENERDSFRALLAEALAWMEEGRASGDWGNWDWHEGDIFTRGMELLRQPNAPPPEKSGISYHGRDIENLTHKEAIKALIFAARRLKYLEELPFELMKVPGR